MGEVAGLCRRGAVQENSTRLLKKIRKAKSLGEYRVLAEQALQ